jgi:hypothetical protein
MHPKQQQGGFYSMLLAELSAQPSSSDDDSFPAVRATASEDMSSLLDLLPYNQRWAGCLVSDTTGAPWHVFL